MWQKKPDYVASGISKEKFEELIEAVLCQTGRIDEVALDLTKLTASIDAVKKAITDLEAAVTANSGTSAADQAAVDNAAQTLTDAATAAEATLTPPST